MTHGLAASGHGEDVQGRYGAESYHLLLLEAWRSFSGLMAVARGAGLVMSVTTAVAAVWVELFVQTVWPLRD